MKKGHFVTRILVFNSHIHFTKCHQHQEQFLNTLTWYDKEQHKVRSRPQLRRFLVAQI